MTQMTYMKDYDIVCTNAELINSEGTLIGTSYCSDFCKNMRLTLAHLFLRNYVITSTVLLKKGIVSGTLFDERRSKSMAEDYDVWMKLASTNLIYFINNCLIKYRIHTSPFHKGEDYFLIYENSIDLLRKYRTLAPKSYRKYASWGVFKFRKDFIRLILS